MRAGKCITKRAQSYVYVLMTMVVPDPHRVCTLYGLISFVRVYTIRMIAHHRIHYYTLLHVPPEDQ